MSKHRRFFSRLAAAVLPVAAALSLAVEAHAQQARVVVLPRMTMDGAAADESPLESVAIAALKEKGLRVAELKAALSSQKLAFSESVLAGRIPQELTVLGADMIFSAQLGCTKASDGILDSQIKAFFCVLSAKVVRVDSGDVVMAESRDWTVHGLNSQMAVQYLMKGGMPAVMKELVSKAVAAWGNAAGWSLDLVITGLDGKKSADAAAAATASLPGVTGARLVVFNKDYAQVAVEGREALALAGLADLLESENGPQLKITYYSGRVIHAEVDTARRFRTKAAVFLYAPATVGERSGGSAVTGNTLEFFRPYLANLELLDVIRLERTGASGRAGERSRILAGLKGRNVPVALFTAIENNASKEWRCAIEAVSVSGGVKLAAAESSAPSPEEAIGAAVRLMDAEYKKALARPGVTEKIGLASGPALPAGPAVVVDTVKLDQVFPALLPHYRGSGIGLLSVKNAGKNPVEEGEARFAIGRYVISTVRFGNIPEGGKVEVKIGLDALPEGAGENIQYLQLSAAVSFRVGQSWGRADAYAPLVVHQALSMDWAEPESIAAFIDPSDPQVRSLAENAMAAAPERPAGFVAQPLSAAAAIFSSLWHRPLRYVSDPSDTGLGAGMDSVRNPAAMLSGLSGDCDDLTVLYASLCESVGVATAVMVLPGHVLTGVDSGALAGGHALYGLPASMFVEVDGALFVPVETTGIGDTFAAAWLRGAAAVRAAGRAVTAFRTRDAWRTFPHSASKGAGTVLSAIAPEKGAYASTLARVAEAAPEKAQPWTAGLAALMSGGTAPFKGPDPKAMPLASALIEWISGVPAGDSRISGLCSQGMVEACYDMYVLASAQDGTPAASPGGADVLPEILGALPQNVASMLLDRAGSGTGAEAAEDTPLKKRLREALIRAQETMLKKKGQGKKTGAMLVNPVGGRKGAQLSDPAPIAAQLFWAPVNERR